MTLAGVANHRLRPFLLPLKPAASAGQHRYPVLSKQVRPKVRTRAPGFFASKVCHLPLAGPGIRGGIASPGYF